MDPTPIFAALSEDDATVPDAAGPRTVRELLRRMREEVGAGVGHEVGHEVGHVPGLLSFAGPLGVRPDASRR